MKIGKVVWVGYQERQELRPGSEAVEAAAAVGACTAQHSTGRVHSSVRIAEHGDWGPLCLFWPFLSSKWFPSSGRSFHTSLEQQLPAAIGLWATHRL